MKKIMSVILAVSMLLTIAPAKGLAQNDDFGTDNEPVFVDAQLPQVPVEDIIEHLSKSSGGGDIYHGSGSLTNYKVGDTREIQSYYSSEGTDIECLYIGFFCTIWGQTECSDTIKMNLEKAKKIADEFDTKYGSFIKYFGDKKVDVDNDGKIAILCYDINEEYGSNKPFGGTAGYFWAQDFISTNKMDCIHIDTYPAMGGKANPLGKVEGIYSTLFHEYQHYINYSTSVNKKYTAMDKFTNEAMSMAAEHLLCGYQTVSFRIGEFNSNAPSKQRHSLFEWDSADAGSNYGYAYVWGQYLRTRYAQITGQTSASDAGAEIYAEIMKRLDSSNKSAIEVAADIIYENNPEFITSEQRTNELVRDFCIACSVKAETGKYGFNHEDFAEAINVTNVNIDSVDIDFRIILAIGKNEASVYGRTVANDVAPQIVKGRTMVPIRFVAEALGAEVKWDDTEHKLKIVKDDLEIAITTDSANAEVNGRLITLDSEAFIENGRTYVPLRFVSENLGAKVDWIADTQQVVITK